MDGMATDFTKALVCHFGASLFRVAVAGSRRLLCDTRLLELSGQHGVHAVRDARGAYMGHPSSLGEGDRRRDVNAVVRST